MTTQKEIRATFWAEHPDLDAIARKRRTRSKGQNAQHCDTRMIFIDWIDTLEKEGEISTALANRATL